MSREEVNQSTTCFVNQECSDPGPGHNRAMTYSGGVEPYSGTYYFATTKIYIIGLNQPAQLPNQIVFDMFNLLVKGKI